MNQTILLVRHGQSHANAGGVTLESPIVPLTELGAQQARTLGPLLPSATQVWSSPFKRALDTAEPYCTRVGQQVHLHDDLKEFETFDTVTFSGKSCSERERIVASYWQQADPDQRTGPKGESFREFHERVTRARQHFLPTLQDGSVIFGHGMWMALLFWQMWGFEIVDSFAMAAFRRFQLGFPTPNAGVYAITRVAPNRWELKAHETSMRAVAAIGDGTGQRPHQESAILAV